MWPIHFFNLALLLSLFAEIAADQASPPRFVHVWRKSVHSNHSTIPETTNRIHGGNFAAEYQFNASLIHEQWVLTAAHCAMPRDKPPGMIVAAGKADLRTYFAARIAIPYNENIDEHFFGLQERRVSRVHIHPKYYGPEHGDDLALLFLDAPFRLDGNVETLGLSQRKMKSRMSCTVLGWGLNDFDVQTFKLMFAQPVYAKIPEIGCSYKLSGPFICLEEKGDGICRGDSGSPLICDNEIWGVASFSVSYYQNPSCLEQQEEYFSQVYPHINWIKNVLGGKGTGNMLGVGHLSFTLAFVIWTFV